MFITVPVPKNEQIYTYAPGSSERNKLQNALKELSHDILEIPAIIDGKEVFTGNLGTCIEPHNHKQILAKYHKVNMQVIDMAVNAAVKARTDWEEMPFYHRSAIFLKAAELLSTKYRYLLNAATMLGQSKNVHQAEIDSACELIDFWRFIKKCCRLMPHRQHPDFEVVFAGHDDGFTAEPVQGTDQLKHLLTAAIWQI